MTPKKIMLQVVKNLGNYQTVRLEIECELLPDENVQQAFVDAKLELTKSFDVMYNGMQPQHVQNLNVKGIAATSAETNRTDIPAAYAQMLRACKTLEELRSLYMSEGFPRAMFDGLKNELKAKLATQNTPTPVAQEKIQIKDTVKLVSAPEPAIKQKGSKL